MLTGFGFGKWEVTAVALSPLNEQPKELDKVYGRLKTKETDETVYYMQEFKISCADEEYSKVLEFLRTDEYRIMNIFSKDIDVTMDYSGSFDRSYQPLQMSYVVVCKVVQRRRREQFWIILTKSAATASCIWSKAGFWRKCKGRWEDF